MSTDKSATQLFKEFPPVSKEEWETIIARDLNGADYKNKLLWKTGEGIEILPFYRREDLERLSHTGPVYPFKRKKNDWKICQPVFDKKVTDANATARYALERGANALQFKFHIHRTEGMLGGDLEGTAIQNQEDFKSLLSGIELSTTAIVFDSGMAAPVLLAMLCNEIEDRKSDPESINAVFVYDPYAFIATKGHYPKPEQDFLNEARQMVEFCENHLPGARCLGADARVYHNAGANIIQELAFALSAGNEYLAELTDSGLSADQIAGQIHFSFSIGSEYFLEIAKIRAFRLLWSKIVTAYAPETPDPVSAYVHGETSEWNKTVYDPYTNMLRTTTENMSAAIAGYDSISVLPFNQTYTQPDDFADRIARNTQIILKEEAYFDQVHDPGAGSYYIEKLTDVIAGEAWKQFQEIENQGGILKAITNGSVSVMINESVQKRNRAVAERRRAFVGTNQYPNPDDRMSGERNTEFQTTSLRKSDKEVKVDNERFVESIAKAFKNGAQLGDLIPALFNHEKNLFRPIQPYRATEAFEALRLAVEHHETTPRVFLLPMGRRKMRKARSTFAANYFGCAGYKIEDHIGFDSVAEAVAEIKKSQPEIVVICSSDEEYKDLVEPICRQIKSLDQRPIIVLAGYPEKEIEQYRKAGVDSFIHRNSNLLESLEEFHQKLGIGLN